VDRLRPVSHLLRLGPVRRRAPPGVLDARLERFEQVDDVARARRARCGLDHAALALGLDELFHLAPVIVVVLGRIEVLASESMSNWAMSSSLAVNLPSVDRFGALRWACGSRRRSTSSRERSPRPQADGTRYSLLRMTKVAMPTLLDSCIALRSNA